MNRYAGDNDTGQRYAGPVIDSHHHIWDLAQDRHPWLRADAQVPHRYGDYSEIKQSYRPADYARDTAGANIVASVYVEAEWEPTDPLGETMYVTCQAAATGIPGAIVAQAWLDAPNADAVLASQAACPLVRGVRHKPGGAARADEADCGERTLMSDEAWRRGYALLACHGLHFELQTPWWHLHEAAALAADFPETLIVINHAGVLLDREPATIAGWRTALESVAGHSNVHIKASGLGVPGLAWAAADNRTVIHTLIDVFGAQRVLFGSNFPVDGMFGAFADIFDGVRDAVSDLPFETQRRFFFGNAQHLYRPRWREAALDADSAPHHG